MTDEEYQREYDKAAAELEAAAQGKPATTARGTDGRFAKAETPEKQETPATPEVAAKVEPPEPAKEPPKEPETEPIKAEDPLAALTARLEKAEKMARDNQAWATRAAQEAAELRRQREAEARAKAKPAILDQHPELAEAIRYVATDPVPQQPDPRASWTQAIEKVHPGIFQIPDEDELVKSIADRASREPQAWADPFEAIRLITEEKLAHTERQVGKRFAAEAAKQAQKSAMSVPGAGGGSGVQTPGDPSLQEVQRIQKMSPAEFAAEVRRVKGF